jgi:hypothetical protein
MELLSATPRPLYLRERDPVPVVHEAGWVPGSVRMGLENLSPTGIRSPDRQDCNESQYQIRYRLKNYEAPWLLFASLFYYI